MKRNYYLLFLVAAFFCSGCNSYSKQNERKDEIMEIKTPQFNSDSAFTYIENQVIFGARVPLSKAHENCATYLQQTMQRFADTVMVQEGLVELYDGSVVTAKNIISSYCPWSKNRILLCAHWDSRPFSDNEDSNVFTPVLGANDGASGVGVLMEIARCLAQDGLQIGIDIIFFDVEDQGIPEFEDDYKDNTWCLGSQYWSKTPHTMFYRANYGILLDMVGNSNPRYTKEEVSRVFAPGLVEKVWNVANQLGYGLSFVNQNTPAILDDHLYVNQIAQIPMIDIVQNQEGTSFFEHWHTVNDNIDVIDKDALKQVAHVVYTILYSETK